MKPSVTGLHSITKTSVKADVENAPVMRASWIDADIAPDYIHVEYLYARESDGDGWVRHRWATYSVLVQGGRVLKPAKDGSLRVSASQRHDVVWHGSISCPVDSEDLPDWLAALVDECRPSGEVSV